MPVFYATFQECTVCSALISAWQEIKAHKSAAVGDGGGPRVLNLNADYMISKVKCNAEVNTSKHLVQ